MLKAAWRAGRAEKSRDEKKLKENIQKVIPDGIICASGIHETLPYDDPNRLIGKETLVETKTLSSLAQSPDERAEAFQRDVLKRAEKLNADFPGSTFVRTIKSYGKDGLYLVLVDGPFSNLSKDVDVLVDLVARLRALRLLGQPSRWNLHQNRERLATGRSRSARQQYHYSYRC